MDAKETTIYAAILISSIIIGAILIYFIISLVRQQRRSIALYKRAIESEIRTLEKERARMAADLHDELGPVLSAIKFQVGSLDVSADDEITVEKANDNIDGLVERMRSISNDLMPVILVRKGVVPALEDLIYQLKPTLGFDVNFIHDEIPQLPPEQVIHLYRIITEIIHNTKKHANAARLDISLKVSGYYIVLQTEDNGQGFEYEQVSRRSAGHGLSSLLSRTELLNGELFVESIIGKGTIFHFRIPFKPATA
jgi:two-component system, NarL family, sensor kinase